MKWLAVILICLLTSCRTSRQITQLPQGVKDMKREFRGAWIQTVYQGEYKDMTPDVMRKDFIRKLNYLKKCGINAIIFQVRPEADAFYASKLEPWSRFFTGVQGMPPEGNFDLMEFLIQECHKRNMEFHAWLNPYRAGSVGGTKFAKSHIYHKHPERFLIYNKHYLFDPGIPENRQFICQVVRDIVTRYDVDAIHMDDYFYPYPAAGAPFPDDDSFRRYGLTKGFKASQRADWRRDNVNKLIEELHRTIILAKPWVRFGISPFGIYRNKKSTPDGSGSNTNGLQNYDDLYADILLWVKNGWLDYNMPQIYWEIGHPAADYITLIKWWNKHAYNRHLYIGQSVDRTMKADELPRKMLYERSLSKVKGNCFWPANEILWDNRGVTDSLQNNYHRYPALIPAYTHQCDKAPKGVRKLKTEWTEKGLRLHWDAKQDPNNPELANYFVVYCFKDGEPLNLTDPSKIVLVTRQQGCLLPYKEGNVKYRYVVTAVDRFHNESKGKVAKVKL